MKFFNKTMLLLTLTAISSQVFAADAGQKGLKADQDAFNAYDKIYTELLAKDAANFTAADLVKFRNALKSLSGISDASIRALVATSKANLAKEIPGLKALKDALEQGKPHPLPFPQDLDLDKKLAANAENLLFYTVARNQLPLTKLLVGLGAKIDPAARLAWLNATYKGDAAKPYAEMIAYLQELQKGGAAAK